ncbi:hypothetical protein RUND412_009665 [Rhizina undulata]
MAHLSSNEIAHDQMPITHPGNSLAQHSAMFISARARNNASKSNSPNTSREENRFPNAKISYNTAHTFRNDNSIAAVVKLEHHDGSSSISFTSSAIPAGGARENHIRPAPSSTSTAYFIAVHKPGPLPSHSAASKGISDEWSASLKRVASQSETSRVSKKPNIASKEGNRTQSRGQLSQSKGPHYYSLGPKPSKPLHMISPKASAQSPFSHSSTSSSLEAPRAAKDKPKSLSFEQERYWTVITHDFNSKSGMRRPALSLSEMYFDLIERGVTDTFFQLDPASDIVARLFHYVRVVLKQFIVIFIILVIAIVIILNNGDDGYDEDDDELFENTGNDVFGANH